ncbi:MAG: type II secretion system protein GspC [Agarilytica sp.]
MSQQLTQGAFVTLMSEKLQRVVGVLLRFPVAGWRGVVLFLAAAWMVHSVASLFWVLLPQPEIGLPNKLAMPVEQSAGGQSSSQSVSFDSIASLGKIFGNASAANVVVKKPVAKPSDDIQANKTTRLSLKLHGLFSSSDPKEGSAIIAGGNKQALYSVGDEINGNRGVKLARVLEKRVILNNKGSMESLWLFSEEDFSVSARAKPKAKSESPSKPKNNNIRTSARPDQIPKNIGDVVRFSVHREGGKMVGYRIRPGRDRELFTQVGLKANDIVTSVNGIEVNDPKQIRSVYKSMKTATEAQLNVLRDGDTHSITISLDSGA